MKISSAKVDSTEYRIKFIIEDFISNPQRTKPRNVSAFTEEINQMQIDEDIFCTSTFDVNTISY